MPSDAIRTYHDLLTDALAAASQERLDEQQKRRGLGFGDRPLCTVLRPRFLTVEQYCFLRSRVGLLLGAFDAVQRRAVADDVFRRQFRLSRDEETLFAIEPGFPCATPTARLDAFFTPNDQGSGELFFTEYNAETPAAPAYSDGLGEIFSTLPIMTEFRRKYNAVVQPARPGVYHALVESFVHWRGRRELPRIGILDWSEVPTFAEFVLFREYFRDQGMECVIADPRQVEYRGGKLMAGDFHITLIYKRVLISELIQRGRTDHSIVRAVCDGAVCMVNPFRCKVAYKKASLAVLSDEAHASLFTPAQRAAIEGKPIDLVPFLHENRERLVLKPNDDYGGKGIVLGWAVEEARWHEAVAVALKTPYIAQERVVLPSEPFPALVDGNLHIGDRLLDTAPFVTMGEYVDGCLTRIATGPLLNVTAGAARRCRRS